MSLGVTVIIPVWERPAFLEQAVESVVATGYPDLEVLVVDDGSSPGAVARYQQVVDRYSNLASLLRTESVSPLGPGHARNRGLRAATRPLIAFLDSDDVYFENRFAASVPILALDHEADAVYEPAVSQILDGGEVRRNTVRERIDFSASEQGVLATILERGRHWAVSAILARREFLLGLSGFGEDRRSAEDLVLWLKMASTGRLVQGGDAPVAAYRMHASNYSTAKDGSVPDAAWWAMLEVLQWARRRRVPRPTFDLLEFAFVGKTFFIVDQLRRAGLTRDSVSRLARAILASRRVGLSRRAWANLLAATVEGLARRDPGPARQ